MFSKSTFGPGDMEALLSGPSYLMVDPLGPLLDKDEEEVLAEGVASPFFSSPSSYTETCPASPLAIPSPPSPHLSLLGEKVEADLLSLPWLSDELLDITVSSDSSKEDAFSGMDWMAEKIDLSEFDLESIVGSCDTDEQQNSPEDLIASLESGIDMDPLSDPTFTTSSPQGVGVSMSPLFPAACEIKLEVKPDPPSSVPSPSLPPPSLTFTLDLGSEVDVSESKKMLSAESTRTPKIILSFSPSVVLLVSSEEELSSGANDDQSDSDSGVWSVSGSPPHLSSSPSHQRAGSSRTKPYSPPSKSTKTLDKNVKSVSVGSAPKVVEKKLKKMEQNKTAATRYRQKKRAEQEALHVECVDLEKRNRELADKADSISKEIKYLKDLMEEVRNAKKRSKGGRHVKI